MMNEDETLASLKHNLAHGLYGPENAPRHQTRILGRSVRRSSLGAAAGVLLLGAGGAIAATVLSQPQGLTAAQMEAGQVAVIPQSVSPAMASSFSVLNGPVASGTDALPASFKRDVAHSGVERVAGANLNLAVAVTGLSTGTAWVIPGDGTICLFTTDVPGGPIGGGGCVSDAGALAEDLTETGGGIIAGLMPNGVSQVTLTGADGSTRTIPVTDNVYSTTMSPGNPEVVTDYRQAGRTHKIVSSRRQRN